MHLDAQNANSLTFPWLFPIFIFSLTFNKILWLFPDFCQVWNFPDFSLTAGHPENDIPIELLC